MTASFTGEGLLGTRVNPETPVISLVIPTFNESANIGELLARLAEALPADEPFEVIFVDDSTDDTPAVIAEAARCSRLAVSVHHRESPEGGLGGAVTLGLRYAAAPWIVVMDADLRSTHAWPLVPEPSVRAGEAGRLPTWSWRPGTRAAAAGPAWTAGSGSWPPAARPPSPRRCSRVGCAPCPIR